MQLSYGGIFGGHPWPFAVVVVVVLLCVDPSESESGNRTADWLMISQSSRRRSQVECTLRVHLPACDMIRNGAAVFLVISLFALHRTLSQSIISNKKIKTHGMQHCCLFSAIITSLIADNPSSIPSRARTRWSIGVIFASVDENIQCFECSFCISLAAVVGASHHNFEKCRQKSK